MLLPDGTVYLDCNATTPLAPEVSEALDFASRATFGNPSSSHRLGREACALLDAARREVAGLVGCRPGEVIFTSSGTEAAHLAWHSALRSSERRGVLISSVEHPCVSGQADIWREQGFDVTEIPVDGRGALDLEALGQRLGAGTALVSVMAAHNETGVVQPLGEVGRMAREHGALFHTDAVQALGKIRSPWTSARPDYLSLSGHKFYGPKGIGALVARSGAPVRPVLVGGGQEGGARASTEPVPLAHALGIAARLALSAVSETGTETLRDGMEAEMADRFGALVHGLGAPRLPNTSFFSIPGLQGEEAAGALDRVGIFVSSGSACHAGEEGLPRGLTAMGLPGSTTHPVRVSLGRGTTPGDVARLLSALGEILAR